MLRVVLISIVISGFVTAKVLLPKAQEPTTLNNEFYVLPFQLGVEHIEILGEADGNAVIFHFFARMVRKNDHNKFYAKAYIEQQDGNLWFLPGHEQFLEFLPEIVIYGERSEQNHPVKMIKHPNYPVHLDADFEDKSKVFRIVPQGWKRFQHILPTIVHDFYEKSQHLAETPQVIGVMSSVYSDEQNFRYTIKAIVYNVKYHMQIGFAGIVLYLRPSTMKYMLKSTELRKLVLDGALVLVLWNEVTDLTMHFGAYFDQWVICNHATVAFWQQHAYLSFLDPDEFIATEKPATVQELLRGCMAGNAEMYRFLIYNLKCEHCRYDDKHPHAERHLWMDKATIDPLKKYRKMNIPENRGAKLFLNPNFATTMYNHWSDIAEGAVWVDIPGECAYIAHLVHMYYYRASVVSTDDFKLNTTWFWVWDEHSIVF